MFIQTPAGDGAWLPDDPDLLRAVATVEKAQRQTASTSKALIFYFLVGIVTTSILRVLGVPNSVLVPLAAGTGVTGIILWLTNPNRPGTKRYNAAMDTIGDALKSGRALPFGSVAWRLLKDEFWTLSGQNVRAFLEAGSKNGPHNAIMARYVAELPDMEGGRISPEKLSTITGLAHLAALRLDEIRRKNLPDPDAEQL